VEQKPRNLEISYKGQFDGINSQAPENIIPPTHQSFIKNFLLRNKQLVSFPRFKKTFAYPQENHPLRMIQSFLDTNNVTHTVGLTAHNAYQLNYIAADKGQPERWVWNQIGSFDGLDQFYANAVYLNKLYFTTVKPGLFYWDGITNNIQEATNYTLGNAYDNTKPIYGGQFLGELANHLILLNTVEKDPAISAGTQQNYTQRMRWSATGLPNVWNPAVNPNAGFNDMLDVPDSITGFVTIGKYGYIFRTNGISQVVPTGLGARPFQWDHMWASNQGIGNIFSSSIASYGAIAGFVSTEQIYLLTLSGMQPIGGGARDAILTDLATSIASPFGSLVPAYRSKFVFVNYSLTIIQNNKTVLWIYNVEENSWTRRELPGIFVASPLVYAWVK
jgi:hypothetical protein